MALKGPPLGAYRSASAIYHYTRTQFWQHSQVYPQEQLVFYCFFSTQVREGYWHREKLHAPCMIGSDAAERSLLLLYHSGPILVRYFKTSIKKVSHKSGSFNEHYGALPQ